MTRTELGEIIVGKLKEIQKVYFDYLKQFDTEYINDDSCVLSASVFENSVSAFSIVGHVEDEDNVKHPIYSIDIHSELGDGVITRNLITLDSLVKKEEEDGKENTAE